MAIKQILDQRFPATKIRASLHIHFVRVEEMNDKPSILRINDFQFCIAKSEITKKKKHFISS